MDNTIGDFMQINKEQLLAEHRTRCEQIHKEMFTNFQLVGDTIAQVDYYYEQCRLYSTEVATPTRELVKQIRGDWDYDFSTTADPILPYNDLMTGLHDITYSFIDAFEQTEPIATMITNAKEMRLAARKEAESEIKVDNIAYRVLGKAEVLWVGWESDNVAWVVKTDSGNKLVMSNHGLLIFATADALQSKIDEYQQAITNSTNLLNLL